MAKHTVEELNRMRELVGIVDGDNDSRVIENRLQTYLLNGTTLAELEEAAVRAQDRQAQYDQTHKEYLQGKWQDRHAAKKSSWWL